MSKTSLSLQEKMFGIVEKCQASETTTKDFCKSHNINEHVYYYWQAKYRSQQTPEKFVSLELSSLPDVLSGEVSITYPNGINLCLSGEIHITTLKALLQ